MGMLRDSSASICLGSRVEEEEEEEEGVSVVGEGVRGSLEVAFVVVVAAEMTAERRRKRKSGSELRDGGGGFMVETREQGVSFRDVGTWEVK